MTTEKLYTPYNNEMFAEFVINYLQEMTMKFQFWLFIISTSIKSKLNHKVNNNKFPSFWTKQILTLTFIK